MKESIINGRSYYFENISGTVIEASQNIESKVSGGGGRISQGSGFVAPIFSRAVVHNQIFITDRTGRERSLEIEGINLSCRSGHDIKVTKLTRKNGKTEFIAAANYTTQSVFYNVLAINRLFDATLSQILRMTLISFAVGFGLFILGRSSIFVTIIFGGALGICIAPCYFIYYALVTMPKLGGEFIKQYNIENYD